MFYMRYYEKYHEKKKKKIRNIKVALVCRRVLKISEGQTEL